MECPLDGTTLEPHQVHSINIVECLQCRGFWFVKEELRKAKDKAEPDLNWFDCHLWCNQESFKTVWTTRKCPQCGKNMATISYPLTGGAVDWCVDMHGAWLDKGEFQAILEALDKEIMTMHVSDYIKASLEEAKGIVLGGGGLISELRGDREWLKG